MACNDPTIPHYLRWDGCTIYSTTNFEDEDRIYRVGNPIEFPSVTTALSCKWGKIIKEVDVLKTPPLGQNDFCFSFVKEIRSFSLIRENVNGNHIGWHKLTCVLNHDPTPCDFSHCEILIKHQIYNNKGCSGIPSFNQTYTYADWSNKRCILQKKKNNFMKSLRKAYRLEMIKLISRTV